MSVDLTNLLIDIEDQRHYNSCVGQAISTYLEAIWKKFDGNPKEFSPAFVWQHNKRDPAKNDGLNGDAAMLSLKKVGICLEATFPYNDANSTIRPPAEAYAEANKYRIGSYKKITSIDEAKTYLDKGLPCIFAIRFPPIELQGVPLNDHPFHWKRAPTDGGWHEMVLAGYNDNGYLVVNSWGQWGAGGLTLIPGEELTKRGFNGFVITGLKWQFLKAAKKWFKGIFK